MYYARAQSCYAIGHVCKSTYSLTAMLNLSSAECFYRDKAYQWVRGRLSACVSSVFLGHREWGSISVLLFFSLSMAAGVTDYLIHWPTSVIEDCTVYYSTEISWRELHSFRLGLLFSLLASSFNLYPVLNLSMINSVVKGVQSD